MCVGRSLKEKVLCYLNICQRILETVRNFQLCGLSVSTLHPGTGVCLLFKSFFSAVPYCILCEYHLFLCMSSNISSIILHEIFTTFPFINFCYKHTHIRH